MSRIYATTGMAIDDSAGGTVVDPTGLVGTTSFISSISESTANQDIVGTAWANITNLGGTIITTRTIPVLVFSRAEFTAAGTVNAYFRLNINNGGTIYPNQTNSPGWIQYLPTANETGAFSISYLVNLASGTNTVILQSTTKNASGTVTITEYSHLGYTVLGK